MAPVITPRNVNSVFTFQNWMCLYEHPRSSHGWMNFLFPWNSCIHHLSSFFLSLSDILHVFKTVSEMFNCIYVRIFNFSQFSYIFLGPFGLPWEAVAKDSRSILGPCFLKCFLHSSWDFSRQTVIYIVLFSELQHNLGYKKSSVHRLILLV